MSRSLLDDLRSTLGQLSPEEARRTVDLPRAGLSVPLPSVLLCAESLGLAARTIQDELSPVGDATWTLTEVGQRFLRFFQQAESGSADHWPAHVVATVPPQVRSEFELRNPTLARTQECIADLFRGCRDELLIVSPYIDTGFSHLGTLISPAAAVRLITTILPDRFGTKPPPALGRIAGAHPNFRMRYLCERNEFGAQQTQIHAKVFIADNRQAYVGSANLTETSLIHNLELGLLVEDTNLVTELRRVFLDVYENFAKPFS